MCVMCVCLCVHVCTHSCTLWHMCLGQSGTTTVWVSPPCSFEAGSAVVHCYCLKVSGDSCLCPISFRQLWNYRCTYYGTSFTWVLRCPSLVLTFAWQAFHPRSHHPQPQPQLCVCMCIHRTRNTISLTNYIMNP